MRPISEARWRVLSLDLPATLAPVLAVALRWSLYGLVGMASLSVIAGIMAEEGLVPGADAATTTDLVSRGVLGALLVLGPMLLLAWALTAGLRGPLVARSLARTARRGVDPAEVPSRGQWQQAVADTPSLLRTVSMILLVASGLVAVVFVWATLASSDGTGVLMIAAVAGMLALVAGSWWLARSVLPQWQARSLEVMREHWTTPHRVIANGRELTDDRDARAGDAGPAAAIPGRAAARLEQLCLAAVGFCAGIGLLAAQLMFSLAYPDRERWAGGRVGERAELDPAGEQAVDLVVLVIGVSAGLALLLLALAVACEAVSRAQQHRAVQAALADDSLPRPRLSLLRELMRPTPAPLLRMLGLLCGAVGALGWSLWFIALVADSPDWSFYAAAPQVLRTAAVSGPWIMLVSAGALATAVVAGCVIEVRDRRFRDEIVQRWPVRPTEPVPKD